MARNLTSADRPQAGELRADYRTIVVERREGALEIAFDRPDQRNAINEEMAEELQDAMRAVELDREILVVILRGDERAFCAGADLGGFQDLPEDRYDNYRARYNQRRLRAFFQYLQQYTKPVISAVEGYCLGGGFEIAMLGDLIVAGEGAQFGLPEGRYSIIPGGGGTQNLPRLIGAPLAKELIWTARRIGAAEAREYRIVNHVVPKGGALAKARELAAEMRNVGPLSIMMSKQAINRGRDLPLHLGTLQEADLFYLLSWAEDREEGLKAFAERRQPAFRGQ